MDKLNILWADDEIDLLKPHILFLRDKGFVVTTATNGHDALELIGKHEYGIVLLDENMPGLSGLETLDRIKSAHPGLPVVMITKSEEEHIMEDAIGSKIADYLIKPVNPNQILLSIKKSLDTKRLVSEKTSSVYQQEFRSIGTTLSERLDFNQWMDVYKKLVYWELELEKSKDPGMYEILTMQKNEANLLFGKFVESAYAGWLKSEQNSPVMSHTLFRRKILPVIEGTEDPVFFVLIDNLRFDQWKTLVPVLSEFLKIVEEETYYSILPTATQYSRNAIFAGMMPLDIEKRFPKLWSYDDDEGGKNLHEEEFLMDQIQRLGKNIKTSYHKITHLDAGKDLQENITNLFNNKFNVIVYNFVDMLSHARTDMQVIRELADDESAYRSLTLSWFQHSPLLEILRKIASKKSKIVISTDHGTIRVKEPSKIIGDRNTNTNLRYKAGKNLNFDKRDVYEVKNPAEAMLPRSNLSTSYVFARQDKFFAYPNNYNYYVNFYKNTLQHGGISLEEMIIPVATLINR
ncbi:MAG TPA: bifunctional response regulator/alkaline phosphatase family protein [Bacteroidia bacterium]|nr:bifunctional response regulator/alkaline phosphatase family protein [Bacteroidia bacterium]